MNRNLKTLLAASCVALLAALPAQAATLSSGYTAGGSSQLLSTNGGAGATLFVDSATTIGGTNIQDADGFAPFFSVLLPGTGLWNIGDTVSISGLALNIKNNVTLSETLTGNFTFDIRQGAGGTGASGAGGLSSLGTATASYTAALNDIFYVNFDTPVNFVADANSTSIGINIANGARLTLRRVTVAPGRLQQYNYANGALVNLGTSYLSFSVAGSVTPAIPEPSAFALLALGVAGVLTRRRTLA